MDLKYNTFAQSDQGLQVYAGNEDLDQPVHMHSLTWAFVTRNTEDWLLYNK